MATNKKPVLIAGVCALVLALTIVGGVVWSFGRPEAAAERFLAQLGKGEASAAYLSTTASFQQGTTGAQFGRILRRTGLSQYASCAWSKKEVQGAAASLQGEFLTTTGKKLPMTLQLAKEGRTWRVLGFEVTGTVAPPELPDRQEVVRLVNRVIRDFAAAVQARDFTAFHQTLASTWQAEVTPQQFAEHFAGFFDERLDLGRATDVLPTLDPRPFIDRDNALDVEGFYPTTPSRVRFRLRFVDQGGDWRLVSLSVRLVPIDSSPAPPSLLPAPAPQHKHHRRR